MLQLTEKETEPELDPVRINETINNFQRIVTSAADILWNCQTAKKDWYRGAKNAKSSCKRVITLSIEQKHIPQTKT